MNRIFILVFLKLLLLGCSSTNHPADLTAAAQAVLSNGKLLSKEQQQAFHLDDFYEDQFRFHDTDACGLKAAIDGHLKGASEIFDIKKHVVVSRKDGQHDPKFQNELDQTENISRAFMDIMNGYIEFTQLVDKEPSQVPMVLYFNGGLNPQNDVEVQAARQIPCMLADGIYPVFMIWDTGIFSTYIEQTVSVQNGYETNGEVTFIQAPFKAILRDLGTGVAELPLDIFSTNLRDIETFLRADSCLLSITRCKLDVVRDGLVNEGEAISEIKNIVADLDTAGGTKQVRVDREQSDASRTLRYVAATPLRLLGTIPVHGLGEQAWENMKRRTRMAMRRIQEYEPYYQPEACPQEWQDRLKAYPKGTGAFAQFFALLNAVFQPQGREAILGRKYALGDENSGGDCLPAKTQELKASFERYESKLADMKLTMIGHSMGTILINDIIRAFPDLPYFDIVFMAAAADVQETTSMMQAFLGSHTEDNEQDIINGRRFYNLSLHPVNERRERQGGGAAPSGSLLVWIETMFDVPSHPSQRMMGAWNSALSARLTWDDKINKRSLFRVFNLGYDQVDGVFNPFWHSHFNDDRTCFWRPSFWGVAKTDLAQQRYQGFAYSQDEDLSLLQDCVVQPELGLDGKPVSYLFRP